MTEIPKPQCHHREGWCDGRSDVKHQQNHRGGAAATPEDDLGNRLRVPTPSEEYTTKTSSCHAAFASSFHLHNMSTERAFVHCVPCQLNPLETPSLSQPLAAQYQTLFNPNIRSSESASAVRARVSLCVRTNVLSQHIRIFIIHQAKVSVTILVAKPVAVGHRWRHVDLEGVVSKRTRGMWDVSLLMGRDHLASVGTGEWLRHHTGPQEILEVPLGRRLVLPRPEDPSIGLFECGDLGIDEGLDVVVVG